jgi:hypothetical protein
MKIRIVSMAGLLLAGGLLSVLGCGSKGTGGGGGSGGGTGGGAAKDPTCEAYCTTIQANCTAMNQQYSSKDNCLNSCKAIPVGKSADTSGNTLGCRIYHAGAAKSAPDMHCPHAGPGGDGTCGATCDGYCQIAEMYCTDANKAKVYTDAADCQADCKAHKDDVRFNISIDSGNHVACLLYHVQEASSVPADHCNGDLAKTSPSCKDTGAGGSGGAGGGGGAGGK